MCLCNSIQHCHDIQLYMNRLHVSFMLNRAAHNRFWNTIKYCFFVLQTNGNGVYRLSYMPSQTHYWDVWCNVGSQYCSWFEPRYATIFLSGPFHFNFTMMSSNVLLTLCEGNPPVTGGFPSQRPATRSFDVFFDLLLNKRLSKQSRRWWFQTPSCSLWRHYNDLSLVKGNRCYFMWMMGIC